MPGDGRGYVAALDIGTTTLKCHILDSQLKTIGSAYAKVKLYYPKPGYVEIKPDDLWNDVIHVVKQAISDSAVNVQEVLSLGLSTQRGTFLTWRKSNGKPFHNFITWKDTRTKLLVKQANAFWTVRALKWCAYFLHIFTRSTKFFVGSRLNVTSSYASIRLLWALSNLSDLQMEVSKKNVMFGTVDTWLVYKFTLCKTYVTDFSNATATGLFDPFELNWGILTSLFNIPKEILPKIVENDYDFGEIDASIFGSPIKIGCVISDQSASMIGASCLKENDLKVTLGTGGFLNVNTGSSIHGSSRGMYPLVSWKLNGNVIFMSEVSCNDVGSLIEWAINTDLIKSPLDSYNMATKINDNDGVYFIAAFSGLGPPINNERAASGFIGLKPTTRKEHMVRAILESIVFRIALTVKLLTDERPAHYKCIRVDGGVAKNNFICQMLANITRLNVERLSSTELSILGAGYLAGCSIELWKRNESLDKFITIEETFYPTNIDNQKKSCSKELDNWLRAANKFKSWYKNDEEEI